MIEPDGFEDDTHYLVVRGAAEAMEILAYASTGYTQIRAQRDADSLDGSLRRTD
jgi:hypothetical protein